MEMYLGICMVVVVIGITVTLASRFITSGILGEIERVKRRRAERNMVVFTKIVESIMNTVIPKVKSDISEFEKEIGKKQTTRKKPTKNDSEESSEKE